MTEEFYHQNLFGEAVDFGAEEEEAAVRSKTKEFNIFALTDAIAKRDKREAWVVYEKALASGMVADEIFYRVFWGVKILLLTSKTKSAEEAGLNPFVYKKSKTALQHWSLEELETISEKLVSGHHLARRGQGEMETMIEKILLSL